MAKYEYEYIINPINNPEGYGLLTIIVDNSPVILFLSLDSLDHAPLIPILDSDITSLEKYVDYLGDDPNRPFNLQEILLIINN
jgi:hypothetical protein